MKGSDKTLILIVGGIILLLIIAFGLVLLRPEPEYIADENPDGVVHNYLLALRQKDYERAYSYISKSTKVGELEDFIDAVEDSWYGFEMGSNMSLAVVETNVTSNDSARVEVRKTRSNNELLGSSQYSNTFTVNLKNNAGKWEIVDSDQYWDDCWDSDSECS